MHERLACRASKETGACDVRSICKNVGGGGGRVGAAKGVNRCGGIRRKRRKRGGGSVPFSFEQPPPCSRRRHGGREPRRLVDRRKLGNVEDLPLPLPPNIRGCRLRIKTVGDSEKLRPVKIHLEAPFPLPCMLSSNRDSVHIYKWAR